MSLTLRLTLTYLLVTIAGLALLSIGFLTLAGQYLAERGKRELSLQVEVAAGLLAELADQPAELQALAAGGLIKGLLPAETAVRFFNERGVLISGPAELGPFPSRPVLALISNPLPLPVSQVADRRYAAGSIPGPDGPLGVIELSRSVADEQALLGVLRNLALQAALAAALAMSLVSLLIARSISRPVLHLAGRAEQLIKELAERRPSETPDTHAAQGGRSEIARLADALERLDQQVRAYLARIDDLEQARARFLRNVSHELRTPLTAIGGTIENLQDRALPDQQAALAIIAGETRRLARLVDDLLQLPPGAMLPGERRPLDLASLIEEVCELQQGRARRAGIRLQTSAGDTVTVLGDRDRLKQALLNLVDNALRYTPAGGAVELRLLTGQQWAEVWVIDSGPGIPPAMREQVWERGVRGAEGGSGLGLAIVREIVNAHGGSSFVADYGPPGAAVVLRLPVRETGIRSTG